MITIRARNIFLFLRNNIVNGVESLRDARRFVARLDELKDEERIFLDTALSNESNMEDFYIALTRSKYIRLCA